ncbi:MAG: tryptophan-rich sensory protein [Clostridia bacterium]|nr:tryptophan-rich sensory protein [Clostridia bacterium]
MLKKTLTYAVSIAVALGVGSLSALLTSGSMDIYSSLETPPLSPPSIAFPIVWTVLFTLMGISAARVFIANEYKWNNALTVYAVQLAVNFLWSIIFFNIRALLIAFLWLILLLVLIIIMIKGFYKYDKIAAYLQIPYLLWVTFAGYLNFGIYLLNR